MHFLLSSCKSLIFVIAVPCAVLGATKALHAQPSRNSRTDTAPKVGEMAPTFILESLDRKSKTDLASYRGKKPVVLFFGSYT